MGGICGGRNVIITSKIKEIKNKWAKEINGAK